MTRDRLRRCFCLVALIALLHLGAQAQQSCTPPPKGIVGWWPGDNSYADIVNHNDGTPSGNVGFAPGEVAQAFSFNGVNSFVDLGNPPSLQIAGPITVEAWVMPNEIYTPQAIFSQTSSSNNLGEVQLRINGGDNPDYPNGTFSWYRRPIQGSPAVTVVSTSKVAEVGTWQHVAAVFDGSNYLIYINGMVQSGSPLPDQDNEAFGPDFRIGMEGDNYEPFDGLIDEVSVYKRALKQSEIVAIYNAGRAGKCKDCQVSLPNGAGAWRQSGGTWGNDYYDHSYTVTASDLTAQMRLKDGAASCDIALSKGNLNLAGLASFINNNNKCKTSFKAVVRSRLDSIYDERCLMLGCLNGLGSLQLLKTPSDPQSDILTDRTMGDVGCYVTALAMALSYAKVQNLAGSSLDPGILNRFMGKTLDPKYGSFFPEGDVDGRGTIAAVGQNTTWTQLGSYSKDGTNAAYQDLDNSLCSANPYPVIVGVKGSDPNRFPGHYVLVIGKQAKPDGTAKYLIADPAGRSDSLDYYGNKFQTRGIVKNSSSKKSLQQESPDLSALSVNAGDEADILVIDGNGAMTGFNPDTGTIVQGIPGSIYARDALDEDVNGDPVTGVSHSVDVTVPASGTYRTVVTGITTGTYILTVNGYATDGSAQPQVWFQGAAEPGSRSTYTLQYSPSPGSPPAVTPMPGDRNGDGVVNCADIAIVKASFGKKIGDPGFDPRADANVDGTVNVFDLAIVARALPAGTNCP
jgi:Concanavalin A-like lectin/glucanases superfamily/Dockerin type I domain